ncbi:Cna B-type domain-containing protein [Bifidobacterium adolescentis]|uniref:Cna B-type domain-containing protein n=1 Tax=Bifidobacterium adolescentis TaxID=1680 RepID=UPI0034A21A20
MTFTISPGTAAFKQATTSEGLQIVYDTRVDALKAQEGYHEYTNTAHISVDGNVQTDQSYKLGMNTPKLVSKQGTYNESTAPNVNYTVKINPGAQTLNNGKALTLTDTLGSALDLRMDSILIADSASGKQINGATWSYEPNSKKLVFFIPDKQAVTITYKATVQLKAGETIEGAVGRNEISLEGVDASKGSDTSIVTGTVKTAQGGMTFDSNTLQIYKYIDGDTGRPGANAMFEVQEVNVDLTKCSTAAETAGKKTCSGTVDKTVMNNLTTGTTGYSSQVQLNADRIYKVTELVAPGEKAGEDSAYEKAKPLYVVFPGNDARSADSKTYNGKYDNLVISDNKGNSGSLTVAVANNATLGNYLWYVNNNHKKKTKVSIAKLDAADIKVPVAGASLKLSKWGSSEAPEVWSNWTASMQGVSKDDTGTALTWTTGDTGKQEFKLLPGRYWLEETAAPDGYQIMSPITITVGADGVVTVNGHNVTDKGGTVQVQALDAPKTTNLTVNKVWDDSNDQDGKRRTVTFDLYRKLAGEADYTKMDGQSRDINVNAGDSAAYWFDLPVMVGGKQAEYKAVEATAIDGYTTPQCTDPASAVDGSGMVMTCTNTHAPETTSLGVNKKWNDADNQDRSRPNSITVHLVKNGVKTNQSATLNAANNWSNADAFTNLPVYENGMKITYGVQEDVPSGYTVTTDGVDKNRNITLTNTHHPNNKKVWFSKQSLGGQELAGAMMRLTGTLNDTTKTFAAQTWTSNGSQQSFILDPGTYTLTETKAPAGYTKADDIVFRVDTGTDDKLQVRIRQSDGSYVAADDSLITMVDAYQPHRVAIAKNSLTDGITNIAGATMSVTGRTLDGKSVNSITWTTKQGQSQQLDLQPGTYTLSETNPPAGYTKADDITFSVDINGKITVDGKTQTDGTLTMVDKPDTNGIFFSKTAVGGGAELAGAEFNLTGSTFEGKTIDPITWTSGGTPKRFMLEDGVYTLTETKAPTGYEAVKPLTFTVREGQVYIDGVLQSDRTIRVEDCIATTMVRVRKVWSDSNYGDRPEKVTFHLLRNAKELIDKQYTVEVDSSSSWTHTWTDLPRYDENGERYNYTVDEETTQKLKDGSYRVSITKRPYQDGAEYTVLNTREPDAINAKVTKTWEDNANNDGKRPTKLTFHVWGTSDQPKDPTDLMQGFEARTEQIIVQDVNVSSDADKQFWTFEGLPKQNIYGKSYTYTVTEESVDGYTTSGCSTDADGTNGSDAKAAEQRTGCVFTPTGSSTEKEKDFQVTNKHTPETTTLNVTKQWDDDSDSDNGRPNSLTIWVLSSIWNGKNDQPLPGWPTPQNNSMCSDPTDTKAKNPVGVSCAVLTKNKAKNAVATTEASSDGAKETAGSSGSDTTNVASNEWAYAFTNLPKYYKGKEIHYSVTEEAVNGYKPVSLTGGKTVPQQPNQSETGADESNAQTAAADPNTATDESQDSTDGTNATAESWNYQLTNKYTAVKLPSTGGEGDGTYMRAGLIALLVGTLCLAMALRRKERD